MIINQGEVVARETLGKILTWAKNHTANECIGPSSFSSTSPGYGIPVYMQSFYFSGNAKVKEAVLTGKPVHEYQIHRSEQ